MQNRIISSSFSFAEHKTFSFIAYTFFITLRISIKRILRTSIDVHLLSLIYNSLISYSVQKLSESVNCKNLQTKIYLDWNVFVSDFNYISHYITVGSQSMFSNWART